MAPLVFTTISFLTACAGCCVTPQHKKSMGRLSQVVGLVSKGVSLAIEVYVCFSVMGTANVGDIVLVVVIAMTFIAVKAVEVQHAVGGLLLDLLLAADVAFLVSLMDDTRETLPAIVTVSIASRPVGFVLFMFAAHAAKRAGNAPCWLMCIEGAPVVGVAAGAVIAWWTLLDASWQSAASTALVLIEVTGLVQDLILAFAELVLEASAVVL